DLGHLHVEEGQRHRVDEQQLERLGARTRPQDAQSRLGEKRLEGDQVVLEIVDDEAVDDGRLAHRCALLAWAPRRVPWLGRPSEASSAASPARSRTTAVPTRLIVEAGISDAWALSGSWTSTLPPARSTAAAPAAPSSLAPVSTIASRRSA